MSRRQGAASLVSSPVLVGAVTLLITIVAVFLAYNANSGLPFVPTYDLKANLPNAANLVLGNDVRIAGFRVGTVTKIQPIASTQGKPYARVEMKLQKSVEPLPTNSTLIVRPRSALGLKYVQITPGNAKGGYQPGATIPARNARPVPVEFDEVLNMFDAPTRRGIQESLNGFGTGFAFRGADVNTFIADLNPLLRELQPVAQNLAAPDTQLARFVNALNAAAGEVAPVAETQAALFVNLDTTFTALATVARPFIQDTISQSPPTEDVAIANFPIQRPFIQNTAALFSELAPGVRVLPPTASDLADALEFANPQLLRLPKLNRRLEAVFNTLADFAEDPIVTQGVQRLTETVNDLNPTLTFATPVQTVCNYPVLFFRNTASLLTEGDKNGTWQRFIIIATPQGPNNEGGPSSAPANGPSADNHLHANPYPNTAAPDQTKECEAGNEPYQGGKTVIGNPPGNQGTKTSGQNGGKD